MGTIEDLKSQINARKITFEPPSGTSERLKKELLGENEGTKVTALLQELILEISKLNNIRISSIIRAEGFHGSGRAFDIGNEEIAGTLLPIVATDDKVQQLKIDEIVFDAGVAGESARNKWNYDAGKKHNYDNATLEEHKNHIHFAVINS